MIIAIICSVLAGMSIVLSRSINGLLAKRSDAYTSTFCNYFMGCLVSLIIAVFLEADNLIFQVNDVVNYFPLFIGGMIGVFNIFILNKIVVEISPVLLTLLTFVSQLTSSMILDYFCYSIFSIEKIIGCVVVIIGLMIYQLD